MKLPESARSLIESGAHAHLVTLNPDGSPQVTLVWAGLDGDDIVTDVKFPPMDDPPPGFTNRIKVGRISGVGPWTGRAV